MAPLLILALVGQVVGASAHTPYSEWTNKDKSWVFENFNALWQRAFDKDLIPPGVTKPTIRMFNETPDSNCYGLAVGVGYDSALVFCSSFLSHDESEKIFLLYHEVAHSILQHDAQLAVVKGKPEYAAHRIRIECEAYVLVARLENTDFALRLIKSWTLDEQSALYKFYGPAFGRSIEVLEGKIKNCN